RRAARSAGIEERRSFASGAQGSASSTPRSGGTYGGRPMAGKHDAEKNHEQTLLTLDQLSQTLDAMSIVVERLRRHVTRQASLNAELFQIGQEAAEAGQEEQRKAIRDLREKAFVVEISQQELEDGTDPVLH